MPSTRTKIAVENEANTHGQGKRARRGIPNGNSQINTYQTVGLLTKARRPVVPDACVIARIAEVSSEVARIDRTAKIVTTIAPIITKIGNSFCILSAALRSAAIHHTMVNKPAN